MLLVETSSTEHYDGARGFYRARGFDEEARIRDFYGPGDDKIVFWSALDRLRVEAAADGLNVVVGGCCVHVRRQAPRVKMASRGG